MNEFAKYLRKLLEKYRLSQRELAKRSGVNYVTINRRINQTGQYRMESETINAIADGLGCSEAERFELFFLAGVVTLQIKRAFAGSREIATSMDTIAEQFEPARKRKS